MSYKIEIECVGTSKLCPVLQKYKDAEEISFSGSVFRDFCLFCSHCKMKLIKNSEQKETNMKEDETKILTKEQHNGTNNSK